MNHERLSMLATAVAEVLSHSSYFCRFIYHSQQHFLGRWIAPA
jgi:hypothetical protein